VDRQLKEIEWADPVLPLPEDPEWTREVERVLGEPRAPYLYAAPSPWLREGVLRTAQVQFHHVSDELAWLAILVTSQENACRYCYGAARAYLKLLGLSEQRIEAVERGVKLAEADARERAILQFCRNLSRSNPRPVREEVDAIIALGYPPEAVAEIAYAVVEACLMNRFATFLAVPLVDPIEEAGQGPLDRLMGRFRKLMSGGFPKPLPPGDPPRGDGPFGRLITLITGTEGARVLDGMLRGAFSSPILKRRTTAWMFAVVATALDCRLCGTASCGILEEEGVTRDGIDRVLRSLAGPELDETEAILLPWVRETVHYQTEVIQRKTHDLARKVPGRVLIEAIGVTALANACARLSMLEQ
jgi:alkylhydroperoxidase family enzyme